MTIRESCELAVSLTRELAEARAARDTWKLLAIAAIHQGAELEQQLQIIDARRYVCRRRAADARDRVEDAVA